MPRDTRDPSELERARRDYFARLMQRYGVKRLCRDCDSELSDEHPWHWDCPVCGYIGKSLLNPPRTRLVSVHASPAELLLGARPPEQLAFDFSRQRRDGPGLASTRPPVDLEAAPKRLREGPGLAYTRPPHSEQQAPKRKRGV